MCLLWKVKKYTITTVFLHAEFIYAKSYGFHENAKIIENHSFLLIVWDFHWNSWADCHKKSQNNIFRWKRRQIKQNYKFSKVSENRLNRKVIAFDKFSWNCVLHGNSINIHLLEYLCKQNSYLQWKQCKILRFSWKRKNHRKSFIFVNCLRFSLKLLSRLLQKVIKYYF